MTSAGRAPGIYVHVPFCGRVCPYCDFAVRTGGPQTRAAFLQALAREVEEQASDGSPGPCVQPFAGAPFDTLYVGGGTPSSLAPDALGDLITNVRRRLGLAEGAEITLEANPEDVTPDRVEEWTEIGVTRISLGVQALDDRALERLGRAHTGEQATAAMECALGAAFDVVSVDLIFAVPGQSLASWESTLRHVVELQPHHVSCYELTVHEGTRFFRDRQRGAFSEATADHKAEQFFATHRLLEDAGYPAYEVSNFSRAPELRSRHNEKYWRHVPYLGIGPSAHSFDGDRRRWWNARSLTEWRLAIDQGRTAVDGEETIAPEALVLEALALGLRTTDGVDVDEVRRRWGVDLLSGNVGLIEDLTRRELLRLDGSRLVPTLDGLAVADGLARDFTIGRAQSER